MSAWIAALRIARREVLRAKGRSALVVAMIAVPVAALAGTAVAGEGYFAAAGHNSSGPSMSQDELSALLPAGTVSSAGLYRRDGALLGTLTGLIIGTALFTRAKLPIERRI